ncbi:MAG: SpoIID/LytB domain-containing protein [bacterium]|nr:SpoIID/LytB domain-containing protein [bacterium]
MHWQRSVVLNRPRFSLILAAASVLLVAASVLVAVPSSAQNSPNPQPVLIVDPSSAVSFSGKGWGHGVGMSQWGANSRSQAGHSPAEILDFYYENTQLVENYGYSGSIPTPTPTPTPVTGSTAKQFPTTAQDPAQILLATTDTTTLTPQGLNRITVDNQNIAVGGENAARAPAGTPIVIARAGGLWRITYGTTDVCGNGCPGETAQLHFATDSSVAISTTGRSYSHGRINLIAVAGDPNRFHITVDSLTVEKFLNDPHNDPGPLNVDHGLSEDSVQLLLATTEATTLTPGGLNRITIDNANISYGGQNLIRAPANSPITVTRVNGLWRIQYGSTNVCGTGCTGQTAQLHFGTDTAVAVSTTGRSYSHGRINLIAVAGDPNRFHITVDSLTIEKFFRDPHSGLPTTSAGPLPTTPEPVIEPAPEPAYPEEAIRVHLTTTTGTTLTPQGANRITIDGQGEIRVPAGYPVAITRHAGHWHIVHSGTDVCGNGCSGNSVQLHFATNTSVAVSNTGRSYSHGRINLVPSGGDPSEFYVIVDSLSMEDYLRGIAESPMNWGLSVHKAQAIAARSYASASLRERRASASWTRPFDLYSTVWDQAYVGDLREKHADAATWLRAVEETAGQVLYHGGAPIRAFYHASNGGHTERSGYVFSADLPYLPSKPDAFDDQAINPYASWTRSYSVADLNRWLNDHTDTAVGQLISMEIVGGIGASGRLDKAQIRITGTSRSVTVSGNRLQARINTAARESGQNQLLSTLFSFAVPLATVTTTPADPGEPGDITPADDVFFSGVINGQDFCLNRSLGGPITYAFDSNADGIADVCSLPRTRREAVAHQRTLEDLALVERDIFIARFAEECRSVAETFGEPDKEASDECQQYREFAGNAPGGLTPANGGSGAQELPPAEDPDSYTAADRMFFSGIIDGPDFCLNFSLGGPTTYAFDSDGDGVADVCALPRTRRAAVARQKALEHLANASPKLELLYEFSFNLNCQRGPQTLGEPEKEASDDCEPHIQAGAG